MRGTRVELFRGKDGRWRFRPMAANNEAIAQSESYFTKWNAKRAAKKAFPGWVVVDGESHWGPQG